VLENLDDLGRELGMSLEPTGTEIAVGTFRADIGAKDGSGRSVIIENQHGPSDHGHFGQVVLYALESRADVAIWLVASCGPAGRASRRASAVTVSIRAAT
jgi:hypothetical protein